MGRVVVLEGAPVESCFPYVWDEEHGSLGVLEEHGFSFLFEAKLETMVEESEFGFVRSEVVLL